ncbi:MAG: right-handed parallel beta-helix repeat-containing protein [Kiritimatiellae bacterium]|nr:right-handed parallel beta-helix repeat-containing protein [Kiritimatiellia bacterium]MDD5519311.1 right-handed parallel beta-helix repeat-containing protein [Kiritimatiellia bacterium]
MKKCVFFRIIGISLIFSTITWLLFAADDYWTPKGDPLTEGGKIKTLEQLEPRTIVTNLPFHITNSGSYYLTCSLTGKDGLDGITISTNEVKLDLNGYALNGSTGSYDAITVDIMCQNIAIRNGVIRGWKHMALDATNAADVVLESLKAFGNGWGGLYVGPNSLIERCSAYGNGWSTDDMPLVDPPLNDAIFVGSFSTIKECKVRGNRGAGIHTFYHSRIIECTSCGSINANGFYVQDYCTIKDCTASQNFSHGIRVANRCRVVGNTCGENGFGNATNDICGILIDGNNNVIDNNSIMGNQLGIRIFDGKMGNWVVRNLASKNTENNWPFPPSENFVAPVDLLGGSFTNNNPWSNFAMP